MLIVTAGSIIYLSPSMLLKSLTMAMPKPAIEYSTVKTITSSVRLPNSACRFPRFFTLFDFKKVVATQSMAPHSMNLRALA